MPSFYDPILLWPVASFVGVLTCTRNFWRNSSCGSSWPLACVASYGFYDLFFNRFLQSFMPFLWTYVLGSRMDLYQRYGAPSTERRSYACVTGSTSGIGLEFAKQLASSGFNLVMFGRSLDRLEVAKQEVLNSAKGDGMIGIDIILVPHGSLSEPGTVKTPEFYVSNIWTKHKLDQLDIAIFVNNAGVVYDGRFCNMPMDELQEQLEVNCSAVLYLTKLVYDGMVKRNKKYGPKARSAIINVASRSAWCFSPGSSVYGGAKAFVDHFTKNLAIEGVDDNIDILCLRPALVSTKMTDFLPTNLSFFKWLNTRTITAGQCASGTLDQLGKKTIFGAPITVTYGPWQHAFDAWYCGILQNNFPAHFAQLRFKLFTFMPNSKF